MNQEISWWAPRPEMPIAEYLKLKAAGHIQYTPFGEELLKCTTYDEYVLRWHRFDEQRVVWDVR